MLFSSKGWWYELLTVIRYSIRPFKGMSNYTVGNTICRTGSLFSYHIGVFFFLWNLIANQDSLARTNTWYVFILGGFSCCAKTISTPVVGLVDNSQPTGTTDYWLICNCTQIHRTLSPFVRYSNLKWYDEEDKLILLSPANGPIKILFQAPMKHSHVEVHLRQLGHDHHLTRISSSPKPWNTSVCFLVSR